MDELQYQFELLSAMDQKLSVDEKMFQMLCNTSSSAFLYCSFEDDIIRTFGNWKLFFPIEIQEQKDIKQLYDCIEDKYILKLKELLFLEKKSRRNESTVVRMKEKNLWVKCETVVTYNEKKEPKEKVIRFQNITKLKNQHEELTYMAYYDIMTGLYNRNYFVRLLGDFVRKAEEERKCVAVMFIDIDDFRKINDGFSIVTGDEIIQQFGQFLNSFSSSHVIVSHFNSDIYCIAVYDPCGSRSVEHIYRMIRERLRWPFSLSNALDLSITVSMGVAEYPEATKTTLELINCAEIVMFRSKAMGKNSIQYFNEPMVDDFRQNISIENKLKEAIFDRSFMMYFQPQYNAKDRGLRGVEALIRWRDKDGNMISPSVFIPIAEKNGSIVPIGEWVIEESVRTFAEWKKKYQHKLILSLNISSIQYKRSDFVSKLIKTLQRYHVKPSEVELEITESVLIDDLKEITNKLIALRDYGIRISLDDFGTGYSSLSYLKGLPIDTLKIDKTFIDTVVSDKNSKIITESIIYMVKKLGFETVAEGVETKEQFEYLQSIECDNIQGYFMGRPMPPDKVEELLRQLPKSN